MPEYLAPGVYVEETDTGNKPIEGVSTSTTGMVGVTERGPVDVPILLTSFGEYRRWFGDYLPLEEFRSTDGRSHCYLPHAAEGFFTNGGKRLYLTRVLDTAGATRAAISLHDRGDAASVQTILLRAGRELTGTAANPPALYVLEPGTLSGALPDPDHVRIGDGSEAEYRVVDTVPGGAAIDHVPLNFPLSRSHAPASAVDQIPRSVVDTLNLSAESDAGDSTVQVTGNVAALAAGQIIEIGGSPGSSEHRFLISFTVTGPDAALVLDSPLALAHASGTNAVLLDSTVAPAATQALDLDASAGDGALFLDTLGGNFNVTTDLVVVEPASAAAREARRIGDLQMLSLTTGAYAPYEVAAVEAVTLGDDLAVSSKALTAPANPGTSVIALDNRVGLAGNDVLRVGAGSDAEFVTVAGLPNPAPGGAPPDAGNVLLAQPLNRAHPNGAAVARQLAPVADLTRPAAAVALPVAEDATRIVVTDGAAYAAGDILRLTTSTGQTYYHLLASAAADLNAQPVLLTVPLSGNHAAGSAVSERRPLLTVQALDAGAWGNRLRVSIQDETTGLVSRTRLRTIITPTSLRLASAAGVEAGTVLELLDSDTNEVVGDPVKVVSVDRAANFTLHLGGALSALQLAGEAAAVLAGTHLGVRSREFSLTANLLRRPDPAMPSRDEMVIASETFRHLSMDSRHSRYVQTIVGDTQGEPRRSDRRPEGESWLIRVRDFAQDLAEPDRTAALESIRFGPEALVDVLPSGRRRAARHPFSGGDDSIATLADSTYVGTDDPSPENRTGLQSLKNEEDISLVACPGQTSSAIQGALIDHCEEMRYRFAVLDGERPPNDSLADVQFQRQQFDTKYAALYHPWLVIPEPFPAHLNQVLDYPVPPSGHMLGIYARTDVERGVHKAPANEVVRGIRGLQRILTKGEHDILNPYPVNINVIRDFRRNNRGIRVWGGRVITSDSDWKYVNVRRLLIFLERSIDLGLQHAVFEVNAEPLWARVRRTVSNFLTVVWRNGALEGTKTEEAYFVKCDRTTMTQTDIDSGRLICVVGVAPVKPAEFVIIRIGLWTAHAEN